MNLSLEAEADCSWSHLWPETRDCSGHGRCQLPTTEDDQHSGTGICVCSAGWTGYGDYAGHHHLDDCPVHILTITVLWAIALFTCGGVMVVTAHRLYAIYSGIQAKIDGSLPRLSSSGGSVVGSTSIGGHRVQNDQQRPDWKKQFFSERVVYVLALCWIEGLLNGLFAVMKIQDISDFVTGYHFNATMLRFFGGITWFASVSALIMTWVSVITSALTSSNDASKQIVSTMRLVLCVGGPMLGVITFSMVWGVYHHQNDPAVADQYVTALWSLMSIGLLADGIVTVFFGRKLLQILDDSIRMEQTKFAATGAIPDRHSASQTNNPLLNKKGGGSTTLSAATNSSQYTHTSPSASTSDPTADRDNQPLLGKKTSVNSNRNSGRKPFDIKRKLNPASVAPAPFNGAAGCTDGSTTASCSDSYPPVLPRSSSAGVVPSSASPMFGSTTRGSTSIKPISPPPIVLPRTHESPLPITNISPSAVGVATGTSPENAAAFRSLSERSECGIDGTTNRASVFTFAAVNSAASPDLLIHMNSVDRNRYSNSSSNATHSSELSPRPSLVAQQSPLQTGVAYPSDTDGLLLVGSQPTTTDSSNSPSINRQISLTEGTNTGTLATVPESSFSGLPLAPLLLIVASATPSTPTTGQLASPVQPHTSPRLKYKSSNGSATASGATPSSPGATTPPRESRMQTLRNKLFVFIKFVVMQVVQNSTGLIIMAWLPYGRVKSGYFDAFGSPICQLVVILALLLVGKKN